MTQFTPTNQKMIAQLVLTYKMNLPTPEYTIPALKIFPSFSLIPSLPHSLPNQRSRGNRLKLRLDFCFYGSSSPKHTSKFFFSSSSLSLPLIFFSSSSLDQRSRHRIPVPVGDNIGGGMIFSNSVGWSSGGEPSE
jgi:hypothetical protein